MKLEHFYTKKQSPIFFSILVADQILVALPPLNRPCCVVYFFDGPSSSYSYRHIIHCSEFLFQLFPKFCACAISRKLRWLRYRSLRESTDQHPFTGGRCHQIYATIIINLIYLPESVTRTAQIRWETRLGILGCKVINSRILILISSTPNILLLINRFPKTPIL